MTTHNPSPSRSDAEIESLLEQFFAREMPREFRSASPADPVTQLVSPTDSPSTDTRGSGVIVAILACVVVTVCLVLAPGTFIPTESKSDAVSVADNNPAPLVMPLEKTNPTPNVEAIANTPNDAQPNTLEYTVRTLRGPVEKQTLKTGHGPVERRTETVTTNLSVIDSETGSKVDLTIQEFEIEIFGVPDEDDDTESDNEDDPSPTP